MAEDTGIAEAIEALRTSVNVLKANPELLHTPELSFFKEYLQSFGAKIPSPHEKQQQKPVSSCIFRFSGLGQLIGLIWPCSLLVKAAAAGPRVEELDDDDDLPDLMDEKCHVVEEEVPSFLIPRDSIFPCQ
jgi:hypothetical protein